MKLLLTLLLFSFITVAQSQDFLLCQVTGMNDIAYKINYKDIENGSQCPIVLPSKLTGFEFRVSRHTNSGYLRVVVENKKSKIETKALGGSNEVSLTLSLSDDDGVEVGKQLGFNDGHKIDEISINCTPNFGRDSDDYRYIEGNNNCYSK